MLVKIFIVAIFIILSWNTIKVSERYALLQEQLTEIKNHNQELRKDLLNNKKLLVKQGNTINKNSNLAELNKSQLLKITKIENTLSKVSNSKKSFEQINNTLKKQDKSFVEIKKLIGSYSPLKKPINKNKVIAKPKPGAMKTLNNVYIQFCDTKEHYQNKNYKDAINRLSKLKSELWRIRDFENIKKNNVMATLSAIDITSNKWKAGETSYDLSNVANKINILAPNTNTIGACK